MTASKPTNAPGVMINLIGTITIALQAFLAASTSAIPECRTSLRLPRLKISENLGPTDNFDHIKFRLQTGFPSYKMSLYSEPIPFLKIKPSDELNPPDTVKGGNLGGLFGFYRTFVVAEQAWIHRFNNTRYDLELWNVYMRRNNSAEEDSSLMFVSFNILFQISTRTHSRLAPLLSGVKKLAIDSSSSVQLPYNYDLYALFPYETEFIVYDTHVYPFPPSNLLSRGAEKACPEGNLMKILILADPLGISEPDLVLIQSVLMRSSGIRTNALFRPENVADDDDDEDFVVYARRTGKRKIILRERRIARAAALMLPYRTWEGEAEPPAYPPDCRFLRNVMEIVHARTKGGGFMVRVNFAGRALSCVLLILTFLN